MRKSKQNQLTDGDKTPDVNVKQRALLCSWGLRKAEFETRAEDREVTGTGAEAGVDPRGSQV